MASGRIIRKKISWSKQVNDLPDDTCRLLFTWLIPHLDAQGCMHGEPEVVKSTVFPRRTDLSIEDIETNLQILEAASSCDGDPPLIIRYRVKGERYLCAPSFTSQQGFRRDLGKGEFPPPPHEVLQKFHRSAEEVPEKSSCSADKDEDRDRDQDKDPGTSGLRDFPDQIRGKVGDLLKRWLKKAAKKPDRTAAALTMIRMTGEMAEIYKTVMARTDIAEHHRIGMFGYAVKEALDRDAGSPQYVKAIVENDLAEYDAREATKIEKEDEERLRRRSHDPTDGEFRDIGGVLDGIL